MKQKNYITIHGYAKLREELHNLVSKERPFYVNMVNWAASNGDRSENADYQYGKKRLREIDRRIHHLTKHIENAEVIDPKVHQGLEIVFFGATVTIIRNQTHEQTITIVGQDEIEPLLNKISWNSPLARALLKRQSGEVFYLHTPQGKDEIEIIEVVYA